MSILSTKKLKRRLKSTMKSTKTDSKKEQEPARVPVFMLPHNDLSPIPEDGEVFQGFFVRMSLEPHQERRYLGLMSLSDVDEEAIENLATTGLEFRHYCRPAKVVATKNHRYREMRHKITAE